MPHCTTDFTVSAYTREKKNTSLTATTHTYIHSHKVHSFMTHRRNSTRSVRKAGRAGRRGRLPLLWALLRVKAAARVQLNSPPLTDFLSSPCSACTTTAAVLSSRCVNLKWHPKGKKYHTWLPLARRICDFI